MTHSSVYHRNARGVGFANLVSSQDSSLVLPLARRAGPQVCSRKLYGCHALSRGAGGRPRNVELPEGPLTVMSSTGGSIASSRGGETATNGVSPSPQGPVHEKAAPFKNRQAGERPAQAQTGGLR